MFEGIYSVKLVAKFGLMGLILGHDGCIVGSCFTLVLRGVQIRLAGTILVG